MSAFATSKEPIAIVGSACRFSGGANSPSKLWKLLSQPRDVQRQIPDNRFSAKGFHHANNAHHGRSNVKHAYLLDQDPSVFDAEFFGINSIEARAMDPQQRLLLETVYEAVESAGIPIKGLRGSDTAVYAGIMCGDYEALLLRDLDMVPTYFATGTSRAVLSNRISYCFDWHGPSITVDTACSSSLVAVDMAVRNLREGISHMAVACGSNIILGPEMFVIESKLKMLSPDGLGRMWDKEANGYARGDGVAAVVLKTLSAALADGDYIECLIRETGLNQDGASAGLTMPSARAQSALIRNTYANAGLDIESPAGRPQYFEAHGTGTPAGDPVEAEAISTAFFSHEGNCIDQHLPVGSIKTVLGHTEGTAGVAAILKASLAIQNSVLPPNLLFETLSPSVAPFYEDRLEILKTARPWPIIPEGQPRRASVNSFGFGGSNAHAILESYSKAETDGHLGDVNSGTDSLFTPFVFSSASETSLRNNLAAMAAHIDDQPDIDIHDLAYTLRERRSLFQYRVAFPASSLSELRTAIRARMNDETPTLDIKTPDRSDSGPGCPRILAVFTGQGAQYARMGANLIEKSPYVRQRIQELEAFLHNLPPEDRPTWSLEAELLACSSNSRLGEAVISQPLCTALQIVLVDILSSAKLSFTAVIGHSSGEIAAAYAAGFVSDRDAMYISFYRGLHCRFAASRNGNIKGSMLAVGTSMNDALEICEDEYFAGRVSVAACNSASSVTLSGDDDAIEEIELLLADENKFSRRLKVDQAYHSNHMESCCGPYADSLRRAGIVPHIRLPSTASSCSWFSSVYDGMKMTSDTISAEYWVNNMRRPVLFSQALEAALSDRSTIGFDIVLEVGPHPALQGPAQDTIQDIMNRPLPYHGLLSRYEPAVQAFSDCMGFIWSLHGNTSPDLGSCEATLSANEKPHFNIVKGLPTYQWNHDTKYWHESRRSRRMRLRSDPYHPLLGDPSPDSASYQLRWKNLLRPSDIWWMEGHQVQGQIVLPAAAYVSTALETAQALAGGPGNQIRLVELENFHIYQAFTFSGAHTGVEIHIELSHIRRQKNDCVMAHFTYSAALGGEAAADLALVADAEIKVYLGDASTSLLPKRKATPPHLISVESSRLYNFMEGLEYNFKEPFRSLVKLQRKYGIASCTTKGISATHHGVDSQLLIHPVELDAAIQSVSLAYSYPGDEQLRVLHMPTTISKVRFNPAMLSCTKDDGVSSTYIDIDSTCDHDRRNAEPGAGFAGHFQMYYNEKSHPAIQVDQIWFKPVRSSASDDRKVFYSVDYVHTEADGILAAKHIPIGKTDSDLLRVASRISSFFLRQFDEMLPDDHPARLESPLCHYLNYARHMTTLLKQNKHKYGRLDWIGDSVEDIVAEINAEGFMDNSVVRIMLLVGETMPKVFKGEANMLEQFRISGLLDEYYANGFGTMQSTMWISSILKQLCASRPHLHLIEIGAGTGGATKEILRSLDRSFDSFTFTDISSSFFENAAAVLAPWRERMFFKTLNAEQDPVSQGFEPGSYDVVVAFLVVHATARLDETMRNLRRLLRPGGFLVIGEGNNEGPLQAGSSYIFGPLPGWWRGVEEGRNLTPFVDLTEWDNILRRTGFSGIDTKAPDSMLETFGTLLFVSQAVDERVWLVRNPISSNLARPIIQNKKLIIIGGQTHPIGSITSELSGILQDFVDQIQVYHRLEDLDNSVLDTNGTVIISLVELDQPTFKDITPARWNALKQLFTMERTILWVTSGRLEEEPYSNMTVGFGRSAMHEEEDLRVQFLDIQSPSTNDVPMIAQALVRLLAIKQLDGHGVLHTTEPEIVLDHKRRQLVPRLRPMADANDRLNCVNREITRDVDPRSGPVVELGHDNNGVFAKQSSPFEGSENLEGSQMIELRTTHTAILAVKTYGRGYNFITLGTDSDGLRYLALTSSLASVHKLDRDSVLRCSELGSNEATFLILTAAQLIGRVIVDLVAPGQNILVHNAPPPISTAIYDQAAAKGINVLFAVDISPGTTSPIEYPDSWIQLPQYLSTCDVSAMIPISKLACFVGFSDADDTQNETTIVSSLPTCCLKASHRTLFSRHGIDQAGPSFSELQWALQQAVTSSKPCVGDDAYVPIGLNEFLKTEQPKRSPLAVIDWTKAVSIPVRTTRFDDGMIFKGDRTYWLCGLSGALGISLCDWMITRGVRNLVLTSRRPSIESAWVEEYNRSGITIKIMSCDVTDEQALKDVYHRIIQTLPPVAGILNGAMVLRDVSVRNMTFDQVTDVVKPKVLGSMHLDQIFHEVDLDFFILLSSINCIIGNVGQANYAAANMGMCGIAANRRKRGRAATCINVGAVIGAGYITQSDRQLDAVVEKMAMVHLSEDDFHQIFAEAIETGRLGTAYGRSEFSTGLLDIPPDAPVIPKWYSDPKFACFVVNKTKGGRQPEKGSKQSKAKSLHERLATCEYDQDVLRVIKQAFADQLRSTLQVTTEDEKLMLMRSVELGLDSLISVDIRTWFLKNLHVSIPVLKIMANDVEMMSLAQLAAENVPSALVPQLKGVASSGCTSISNQKETNDSSASPPSTSDGISSSPSSARLSMDKAPSATSTNDIIDWEAESSPQDTAIPTMQVCRDAMPPKSKPEVILLTGVTGLLGHHLLETILARPWTRKIICVAVRSLSDHIESGRLPSPGSQSRVVYYEGDLRLPRLGLSEEEEVKVFNEVDAVIHNGADTSHLKFYSSVRTANVDSTRYLVSGCLPRMIPLHYISSAGVCLLSGLNPFPEVSASLGAGSRPPPENGAHGYMCTKWVCERLLEKVYAAHGLPIRIHRPSTIIREGEDALTSGAERDWVNALLEYSHRLQAVPRALYNSGAFDLVHVQTVCSDVVSGLDQLDGAGLEKGIRFVNNVGDWVIPMNRLTKLGCQRYGGDVLYQELPLEEWSRRAIENGLHPAVAALIETFDEPGAPSYPTLTRARGIGSK